jgi:hypothetical protein
LAIFLKIIKQKLGDLNFTTEEIKTIKAKYHYAILRKSGVLRACSLHQSPCAVMEAAGVDILWMHYAGLCNNCTRACHVG